MVTKMTFKEFGEFSLNQLKVMLDKSFVYYVLAEGMYFLDKCSPLNFNFLDFSLLIWSFPNPSCDLWNQESVFINIAPFSNILGKT